MKNLPGEFLRRMEITMGPEYADFLRSYDEPRSFGLRVNTLKLSAQEFLNISPFQMKPVPWCPTGFYYREEDQPGKHPYHAAGLYYIQEPSAIAVAEVLAPKPGEKVLDLCAAPGGKATQIASKMQGEGLLVANEFHPGRARILAENMERIGVRNALLTNESPDRLADRFPGFFDRILVDAPCSGEGMFRKEPEACLEWSNSNVAMCALRQLDILESAIRMLKPGGYLVYSTCTFSGQENEGVLEKFLHKNTDFTLLELPAMPGIAPGRPAWAGGSPELTRAARLWPHLIRGEGHFIALMQRADDVHPELPGNNKSLLKGRTEPMGVTKDKLKDYQSFAGEYLSSIPQGTFMAFGDNLYITAGELPDLKGIKVIRPGWHLGVWKKNRFEPGHALALSLAKKDFKNFIDLKPQQQEVKAYLRGESLSIAAPKGWLAVTVHGYPLGWGKSDGTVIKNHYPKGLRHLSSP